MAADWVRFCRTKDLAVDEPSVDVAHGEGGRRRLLVRDEGDAYRISAVVVRRDIAASLEELPIRAWLRNRATSLVGFRIDAVGRLLGEAWIPKIGLEAEEFRLYLRTVALECGRLEYFLTGRDVD